MCHQVSHLFLKQASMCLSCLSQVAVAWYRHSFILLKTLLWTGGIALLLMKPALGPESSQLDGQCLLRTPATTAQYSHCSFCESIVGRAVAFKAWSWILFCLPACISASFEPVPVHPDFTVPRLTCFFWGACEVSQWGRSLCRVRVERSEFAGLTASSRFGRGKAFDLSGTGLSGVSDVTKAPRLDSTRALFLGCLEHPAE